MMIKRNTLKMAKLESGEMVQYDVCSNKGSAAYDLEKFKYIGFGKITSIDHVPQTGKKRDFYFFVRKQEG